MHPYDLDVLCKLDYKDNEVIPGDITHIFTQLGFYPYHLITYHKYLKLYIAKCKNLSQLKVKLNFLLPIPIHNPNPCPPSPKNLP